MREEPPVTIVKLSPTLREDYLSFFDHDAFADNPRWASCYCYFNHAPHDSERWKDRTAEQNRQAVAGMIARQALQGYLAYVGEKPVGWCNANLHSSYTSLDDEIPDREHVGAIVCFVVAKAHRGRGIARRLLEAACEGFRQEGIDVIEAYARNDTRDEAANHHGPLALYLSAGFKPVRENGPITVVRKSWKA